RADIEVNPGGQFRGPQHPQSPQADGARRSGRIPACRFARQASRGACDAGAPRPRRQSARRLERLDDRRARQCEPDVRRAVVAPHGGAAGVLFCAPRHPPRAARAFDFVARAMTRGDRLGHSWRQGQLKFPGLASDFAAMIRAALALYEATGRQSYLEQALSWQRALDRDYANAEDGTYYLTAADAEGLVIRPASTADEATPNH